MHLEYMDTQIGILKICASETGITRIEFVSAPDPNTRHASNLTTACRRQLQEYLDGTRKSFDLPLDQEGTDFQKSVWSRLLNIPYGETVSYRDIAVMMDHPKAVRAVGAANGKNPISIIIPCHRVIGSNRKLTGYAGGLNRKAWLLKHEGARLPPA